jgi:hypothetical protein
VLGMDAARLHSGIVAAHPAAFLVMSFVPRSGAWELVTIELSKYLWPLQARRKYIQKSLALS